MALHPSMVATAASSKLNADLLAAFDLLQL